VTGPSDANHGVIGLDPGACTVCMLCARECPDWCIHIEGHPEATDSGPTGPGGRSTSRSRTLVLDRFAIDWSLCMYCGICVEVCPFDALFWAPALAPSEASLVDLVHESGHLQTHLEDVRPAASLPQRNEPRDAGVVVHNDPDGS
jgi:NADH-quinone oxidoreductase subunit I